MQKIRYADAGLDMKKLVLCFIRKLWIVLAAAVVGAVLGGMIYAMTRIVPESEREYQAMSKVYLDFAPDETGEVYQEYNGYTWNDLMATDPILDVTMQYLPEDYTREEVVAATEAEILSDLRLLTVTVTTHSRERCNAILKATGQSLEDRGNAAKEFRQIEVIRTTEAELLAADSRLLQAVLVGLTFTSVLAVLVMLLYYVLDDRIMVAADLRQVTEAAFVGYSGAGERFEKDYEAGLAYLREKTAKIVVLFITQSESVTEEKWKELCEADGVVIEVPYGKIHAVYLSYIIEQLDVRGCTIAGAAIRGAENKFLNWYYGMAGN